MDLLFDIRNPRKISENGFDFTKGNLTFFINLNNIDTLPTGESENSQQDAIEVTLADTMHKWIVGEFLFNKSFDNIMQDINMADEMYVIENGVRYAVARMNIENKEMVGNAQKVYTLQILLNENINIGRNA